MAWGDDWCLQLSPALCHICHCYSYFFIYKWGCIEVWDVCNISNPWRMMWCWCADPKLNMNAHLILSFGPWGRSHFSDRYPLYQYEVESVSPPSFHLTWVPLSNASGHRSCSSEAVIPELSILAAQLEGAPCKHTKIVYLTEGKSF